jgi:hypothetical protein
VFRFQGKSDTDTKPKWGRVATAVPQANVIEGVNLPALSITVISLHALP